MGHRVDVERRHWREQTASDLEDDLNRLVAGMLKESLALGRLDPKSPEYTKRRASIASSWRVFGPTLSQLRARAEREARRATRDALHSRLCEIERTASQHPDAIKKPYIAWKMAIDQVIDWLNGWCRG